MVNTSNSNNAQWFTLYIQTLLSRFHNYYQKKVIIIIRKKEKSWKKKKHLVQYSNQGLLAYEANATTNKPRKPLLTKSHHNF